ncbi:hypothetical protein NSS69_11430 [Macrococcus sp. FSL W8-0367]
MATEKIIDYNAALASKGILYKTIEASPKISDNSIKEADSMPDFIERKEFEQFEKRIDDNLSNINSKLDKLPDQIETKINLSAEKMKNSQMKWFIGIIVSILGLAGRIFGIY